MRRPRAVVFDMDGTILNTLDDLRDALNHALAETGHRHDFGNAAVGMFFGSGAETAAARALEAEAGAPPDPAEVRRVLAVFKAWYPAHCAVRTKPYPGIPGLLADLRAAGVGTAVVSNKLDAAVAALCETHFPGLFGAALGEREPEVRRKPAPDMTLAALARLGVDDPAEAVYVGDSEVDLLTAENAGMACVSVAWGFRTRQFLAGHGARVIADTPADLRRLLLP